MNFKRLRAVFRRVALPDGEIVLKGKIVQVVWIRDSIGRTFETPETETWSNPSVREARRNFVNNARMWLAA